MCEEVSKTGNTGGQPKAGTADNTLCSRQVGVCAQKSKSTLIFNHQYENQIHIVSHAFSCERLLITEFHTSG